MSAADSRSPTALKQQRPVRLSAGVVIVRVDDRKLKFLLLRAYRNWDFPKGMVEQGEDPLAAATREVCEETTLADISFDWGQVFMETGPYSKGKVARYYIARSRAEHVELPINPELGFPEHHEARWVDASTALALVSPRVQPVVRWAFETVTHGQTPGPATPAPWQIQTSNGGSSAA
jgi:bis(5'-nucleosidyl)-tetraphosphatase